MCPPPPDVREVRFMMRVAARKFPGRVAPVVSVARAAVIVR
jgi:hypothetical protein